MPRKKKNDLQAIEKVLREHAIHYPETHEDFPWGERRVKVKGKGFLFMRATPEQISLSVKLPSSRDMAVDLPFAEPTHYGMGKHGWVTATFGEADEVPIDLLKAWIDESFRAVAPKKILKGLGLS